MSALQREGCCHLFTCVPPVPACQLQLPADQRPPEKLVVAQPMFVFGKSEQTFKRPAEESLYEVVEHVSTLSQKRMKVSPFPDLPTFPPSGPVKKNNVFMTSTLVQRNVDLNSAEQGPVRHLAHVLRPATLQPPQGQRSARKAKERANSKISGGNACFLNENVPSARISVQLSMNPNILGATSAGCQPSEGKKDFKSCSPDFIFGENTVERVLGIQKFTQAQIENDSFTTEKLLKSTRKFPIDSPSSRTDPIQNISLIESAAAFSSKPSSKCLLEKIVVVTGEEAEHNVLKINCKLFIFHKTSRSWIERGTGALRLNDTASSDSGTFQSRLIMRNQGSLRLILNSKLWAQMQIQRANHKNLRITATDLEDCRIKVFLIQAGAKDTRYLYAAIHHRLVALRAFDNQKDIRQVESPAEGILQQVSCESCDEDDDDLTPVTKIRSDPSRWTHRQSVACS